MENANAVNPTPEAAPAPAEPATQAPAAEASPAPAETVVSTTPEPTYDEATQKYLENQNIKGTPNEIVAELVKRNQQLRNQPKESVADVLKQETKTEAAPAPAPSSNRSLSDSDIMLAQMAVEKNFPDVKANADFYREMIADGWNPMNGQGLNYDSIFKYAEYKQKLANADKAAAAAAQPGPIPSPSNTIDNNSPLQTVQTMDKLAAENIITWSAQQQRYGKERHPQYQQAVDFLQGEARKGSF